MTTYLKPNMHDRIACISHNLDILGCQKGNILETKA